MVPAKAASALTDFTSPLTKGEFQSLLEKIVGSFEQETGRLDVTQSRAQCPDMSSVLACCASAICCVLCSEHDNIYKPRYRADVPKLERFRTVIGCWFRSMQEVCKKDPGRVLLADLLHAAEPAGHLYFLASKFSI